MNNIENIILNNFLEGIEDIVKKTGIDKNIVKKVIEDSVPEIIKNGKKTDGGLFDNLNETEISKKISKKNNIDHKETVGIINIAIKFIGDKIDGQEAKKILNGLSDGIGIDDVENIASALLTKKNLGEGKSKNEKKFVGGLLGDILGNFLGGRKK